MHWFSKKLANDSGIKMLIGIVRSVHKLNLNKNITETILRVEVNCITFQLNVHFLAASFAQVCEQSNLPGN